MRWAEDHMKNEQLFPRKAGKYYQYESIYLGHLCRLMESTDPMIMLFSVVAIMV